MISKIIKAEHSCKPCRYKPWRWRTRDKIIVMMLIALTLACFAANAAETAHAQHKPTMEQLLRAAVPPAQMQMLSTEIAHWTKQASVRLGSNGKM